MKRYTIDLDKEVEAALTSLAKNKETSRANIFRRALAVYKHFDEELVSHKGSEIALIDSEKKVIKTFLLP